MIKKLILIFLIGVTLNDALASSIKISDSLLETLKKTNGKANVVIEFAQNTQPILDRANQMRFETRGHKITYMKTQLEQLAKESQANVVSILRSHFSQSAPTKFESFWINNRIIVKDASLQLIQAIVSNPEVSEIREEKILHIIDSQQSIPASRKQEQVEWGVGIIEADKAWELVGGNNGQGVVVANIDSGVRSQHEALRGNFRTQYGWFDPIARTPNPRDYDNRGTHTMGIMVGSHGVGIAPGAQWVSCRGCFEYECTEGPLTKCGEWILCPTQWNNQQPDCNKAPNVVSNSWGGPKNDSWYATVVNAWHAASIIPVFEIGSPGSSCGFLHSPGDYETVIAAGATDNTDDILYNSGRGPTVDGRLKPDLSAPGGDVTSSCFESDSSYCTKFGTASSSPHVAGTIALLLAKNPDLTYTQVKDLLQDNADRDLDPNNSACGGTNATEFPNNIYGYGRINARKSLEAAIIGGF